MSGGSRAQYETFLSTHLTSEPIIIVSTKFITGKQISFYLVKVSLLSTIFSFPFFLV